MLLLKGCRRCQGDMYVEREIGATDLVCLQCGHRRSLHVPPPPPRNGAWKLARIA
jgi:hypothetical protein